jgi:hypothetical protein
LHFLHSIGTAQAKPFAHLRMSQMGLCKKKTTVFSTVQPPTNKRRNPARPTGFCQGKGKRYVVQELPNSTSLDEGQMQQLRPYGQHDL